MPIRRSSPPWRFRKLSEWRWVKEAKTKGLIGEAPLPGGVGGGLKNIIITANVSEKKNLTI
jgi:hypothetical protein